MEKKGSYNRDENLLKASQSNNLEIAKKEWILLPDIHKREKKDGKCICSHLIKNVRFIYNIYTHSHISIGTTCCKEFASSIKKLNNDNKFINELYEILKKGEYEIINNIDEFISESQKLLMEIMSNHFNTQCEKEYNNKNKNKLVKLKNEIIYNIENFNLIYLQDIYDKVQLQLDILTQEEDRLKQTQKQTQKQQEMKKEQTQKEQIQKEQIQKEQIQQEQTQIQKEK